MTRTEQALRALRDAIDRALGAGGLVPVVRNETLDDAIAYFGAGGGRDGGGYVNVVDGNPRATGEGQFLGAALRPESEGYEIVHVAEVEIYVMHGDGDRRDSQFDAIVEAVALALAADRTLGGAVDFAEIEPPERELLAVEGLPAIKTALLPVALAFVSPHPL